MVTQERFDEIMDDDGMANYGKFDLIENKRSKRPDLHAFLLLDELVPGEMDIVDAAEHDEIYLGVSADTVREMATENQLVELVRCGVRTGPYGLCMFT